MPPGQPTSYKPEYAEQAFKLCLLGATDAEMASFFDVSESTINNWKVAHPEFLESIRRGKAEADANVASSLYQRALGYSHPEDDIRVADGAIVITPTIKHYPPDTTAGIFWLKNRAPNKWREKTEITGADGGPLQMITEIRRTIVDPKHPDAENIPPATEPGEV